MNRKLIPVLAVALIALAVPIVMAAPKPDQKLSIEASRAIVTFGKELKVSGQLSGGTAKEVSGQKVTLEGDPFPYDGNFKRVDTAQTDASGNYSLTVKPIATSKFRVKAKRAQSGEVLVGVRAKLSLKASDTTPKRGSRVTFKGTLAPRHDTGAKRVKIQRRKQGRWKTVRRATLVDGGSGSSTWSRQLRIRRSGRYRARFSPGDGDHLRGTSRSVRLKTH